MGAKLVIAPEAAEDVRLAFGWYEDQRIGLGEEFLSSVDACIQNIRRMPKVHAKVHQEYRRVLTRKFPYAVFCEYLEEAVYILCVFHTSRRPESWRERLS